jgi:phage terminase large subunit-like protein
VLSVPTKFDAISIRKASKDSSRKIDAAVAAVLAFGIRQEFLMTKGNRGGDTGVLL